MKTKTTADIEKVLHEQGVYPSKVSKHNGAFTIRKGFFYRHNCDENIWKNKVTDAFKNAEIECTVITFGEQYKAFRGGESIEKQSHWFVKLKV